MCSVGALRSTLPATACALSVGGIAALPRKGGTEVPNEDCLYAFDDGRRAVHIVADGHHGHEASHDLIEALAAAFDAHGPTLAPTEAIRLAYESSTAARAAEATRPSARTTLLIAVIDRREGRLEGVTIGDSAIFLGSLDAGVRRIIHSTSTYAAPWDRASLEVPPTSHFSLPISPGEWVITCTDGVTECNYGKPENSIQAADLETLIIRAASLPDHLVESLAALALTGVNGHPGGEDNIAIVASVV